MRIADIKANDIVDCGSGIAVSLWVQGCPYRCKGCHNPSTWDAAGGYDIPLDELIIKLKELINKNGIKRSFSLLGGEPLSDYHKNEVLTIVKELRKEYPNLVIYCWTGGLYEELIKDNIIKQIIDNIDILIDGSFLLEKRDITLYLRGSSNQRVIDIKKTKENDKIIVLKSEN